MLIALGYLKGVLYVIWIAVSAVLIVINLAELFVPTLRGNVGQPSNIAHKRIVLTLTDALQDGNLIFGVRHVRDGKDEVPGHGDLINEDIPFEAIDRSGKIDANIRYQRNLGFQYKCFVDLLDQTHFENLKQRLEAAGFENISEDEENKRRLWFTLKGKPTYITTDKFVNNYSYPNYFGDISNRIVPGNFLRANPTNNSG